MAERAPDLFAPLTPAQRLALSQEYVHFEGGEDAPIDVLIDMVCMAVQAQLDEPSGSIYGWCETAGIAPPVTQALFDDLTRDLSTAVHATAAAWRRRYRGNRP